MTIQIEIDDFVIKTLTDELNDEFDAGDPYRYAQAQIERAFRAYFEREAEEAGALFWDKVRRYLKDPERDLRREQRDALADLAHDWRHA